MPKNAERCFKHLLGLLACAGEHHNIDLFKAVNSVKETVMSSPNAPKEQSAAKCSHFFCPIQSNRRDVVANIDPLDSCKSDRTNSGTVHGSLDHCAATYFDLQPDDA